MTHPYAIDADTLSGMKPLRKVVFSVGSNLGDRLDNLQGAVNELANTPDVIIVDVSPVFETDAVGGPEDNPDFLNAVVVAETTQPPRTLIERAHAIESAYGRNREEINGPRTLDVDVIIVGRTRQDGDPVLPHPRAHERSFVLVPWAAVDEIGEIPGHGRIVDLLKDMDTSGVRRTDLQLEVD